MLLNFVRYLFIRVQLFMRRTEGASAIEYALIVAMVAVVVVAFITPLGSAVKDTLNEVVEALGGTKVA
ncbi:Flp family type IVb pilin [Pseudomonas sp. Pse1]|uniref:Flp family type IVb pilin n=1 Tax=Pseudomonas sp. Pse1 TaxID=2926020 RepID=UPI002118CC26|nr:Flp family type IVb pilin [Pseudomonas sp. Pse1]